MCDLSWKLCRGAPLVYYLFSNIQITIGIGQATLVRIYTDPDNTGHSITRISHYFSQHIMDQANTGTATDGSTLASAEATF